MEERKGGRVGGKERKIIWPNLIIDDLKVKVYVCLLYTYSFTVRLKFKKINWEQHKLFSGLPNSYIQQQTFITDLIVRTQPEL